MTALMVQVLGVAREFDAAVVTGCYGVDGDRRFQVALERAPNPWRERWTLFRAEGVTPDDALDALVADLACGDVETPCALCERPGAVVLTQPHVIDTRHRAGGRVLSPRVALCPLCLYAATSVEDLW